MEKILKESMRRLEQAGVNEELLHHSQAATPLPIPPHTMPLMHRRNRPVEMPILAGEGSPARCYRCNSKIMSRPDAPGHVATGGAANVAVTSIELSDALSEVEPDPPLHLARSR